MAALQRERRRPAACEGQAPGQPGPLGHGQIIGGITDQAAVLGLRQVLGTGLGPRLDPVCGAAFGAMDRENRWRRPWAVRNASRLGPRSLLMTASFSPWPCQRSSTGLSPGRGGCVGLCCRPAGHRLDRVQLGPTGGLGPAMASGSQHRGGADQVVVAAGNSCAATGIELAIAQPVGPGKASLMPESPVSSAQQSALAWARALKTSLRQRVPSLSNSTASVVGADQCNLHVHAVFIGLLHQHLLVRAAISSALSKTFWGSVSMSPGSGSRPWWRGRCGHARRRGR